MLPDRIGGPGSGRIVFPEGRAPRMRDGPAALPIGDPFDRGAV